MTRKGSQNRQSLATRQTRGSYVFYEKRRLTHNNLQESLELRIFTVAA